MVIGKSEQHGVFDSGVFDPGDLSNKGKSRRNDPVVNGGVLVASHVHWRCLGNLDFTLEDIGFSYDSSQQQALASAGLSVDHTMDH